MVLKGVKMILMRKNDAERWCRIQNSLNSIDFMVGDGDGRDAVCTIFAVLDDTMIEFVVELGLCYRLYKPVARKRWLTVYRAHAGLAV